MGEFLGVLFVFGSLEGDGIEFEVGSLCLKTKCSLKVCIFGGDFPFDKW